MEQREQAYDGEGGSSMRRTSSPLGESGDFSVGIAGYLHVRDSTGVPSPHASPQRQSTPEQSAILEHKAFLGPEEQLMSQEMTSLHQRVQHEPSATDVGIAGYHNGIETGGDCSAARADVNHRSTTFANPETGAMRESGMRHRPQEQDSQQQPWFGTHASPIDLAGDDFVWAGGGSNAAYGRTIVRDKDAPMHEGCGGWQGPVVSTGRPHQRCDIQALPVAEARTSEPACAKTLKSETTAESTRYVGGKRGRTALVNGDDQGNRDGRRVKKRVRFEIDCSPQRREKRGNKVGCTRQLMGQLAMKLVRAQIQNQITVQRQMAQLRGELQRQRQQLNSTNEVLVACINDLRRKVAVLSRESNR